MREFWRDERGDGLSEYALIAALVSVGLMTIMVLSVGSMGGIFAFMADVLDRSPESQFAG